MIRVIPFILYLLLVGFHQTIFKDLTQIFYASINIPVLLVLAVAIYKSELTSVWFGFLVGLVMASTMPSNMGLQSLTLALIAFAAFHIRGKLNLDSLLSRLALVAGGVLVHNVVSLVIDQSEGILFLLWSSALVGTLYTTFAGWLFFLVMDGKLTAKKIKAIF